jgi:hypothetical protein
MPTTFSNLESLMPVLDAAHKYDMKATLKQLIKQLISSTMTGDTRQGCLMYEDPLWVYAKARRLGLDKLASVAASATLGMDMTVRPKYRAEVTNMPAAWLWDLIELQKERPLQRNPLSYRQRHSQRNPLTCQPIFLPRPPWERPIANLKNQ